MMLLCVKMQFLIMDIPRKNTFNNGHVLMYCDTGPFIFPKQKNLICVMLYKKFTECSQQAAEYIP